MAGEQSSLAQALRAGHTRNGCVNADSCQPLRFQPQLSETLNA